MARNHHRAQLYLNLPASSELFTTCLQIFCIYLTSKKCCRYLPILNNDLLKYLFQFTMLFCFLCSLNSILASRNEAIDTQRRTNAIRMLSRRFIAWLAPTPNAKRKRNRKMPTICKIHRRSTDNRLSSSSWRIFASIGLQLHSH